MKVGALEESITVSTASPVVDVQSNVKSQVLSRETLDAVPNAHTIQSIGQLIPGVTLTSPDVGGSVQMQQTYFSVHGTGPAGTSMTMDGMIINGLMLDGAVQTYMNDAAAQEMVYRTGGGGGEPADRRAADQRRPARRRQQVRRPAQPGVRELAERQLRPGAEGRGRDERRQARHLPRHQRDAGRADQEGQAVVVRHRPLVAREEAGREHDELGGHDGTGVDQRGGEQCSLGGVPRGGGRGRVPAGDQRRDGQQRWRAPDVAGDLEEQAVALLRPHPQGSRGGAGRA